MNARLYKILIIDLQRVIELSNFREFTASIKQETILGVQIPVPICVLLIVSCDEPGAVFDNFDINVQGLLLVPTSAFTLKNLLRHYAKWAFKHGKSM